jgi:hypothetical protein
MMAIAEQMKSAVGLEKAGTNRSARAAGTKTSNQFNDGFKFTIARSDMNCLARFAAKGNILGRVDE